MKPIQVLLKLSVFILLYLALLLHAQRAEADFHLVHVDEIMAGRDGNGNIQFIELQMDADLQKCQGTGNIIDFATKACDGVGPGAKLVFFDAVGNQTGEFIFPGDTPISDFGRSILIATQQFADLGTMPQPDFIMPALIQPNNGKVCYRNRDAAPFFVNLCVSYGAFTGDTEFFGPPASALPITGNFSLQRNNFDFGNSAFDLCPSKPRNNNGAVTGIGCGAADSGPLISISDATVTEGNSGTVDMMFSVTLSESSDNTITVNFSTANGTATAGTDFVAQSGMLTFDPGQTSKTITVLVNGDNVFEANETFFVNLFNPTNANIIDSQGFGTIVNDDSRPPMLTNISTRGRVLTADNVMIGGFTIEGNSPLRVLVRSRGPSMSAAPFNLAGTLADPKVQLFSGSTMIAQSDNWQVINPLCGFPAVSCGNVFQIISTGLDPCQPNPGQDGSPANCHLEAAILITLPAGAYTAIVSGADGGTGVGLVEVFEADSTSVSELSNISTRGFVQIGENVMIGGMTIEASASSTKVLIRARGPSMGGAPFFLAGTLADPIIQVFSGSTVIAQNDNWQNAPSCSPGFVCGGVAEIIATGLDPCQPNPGQATSPPGCLLESALLITLPSGAFTAIVSGVGAVTGIGIVEAFEID